MVTDEGGMTLLPLWAHRRQLGVKALAPILAGLDLESVELKTEVDPTSGAPLVWNWTVKVRGEGVPRIYRHDNTKGALPQRSKP